MNLFILEYAVSNLVQGLNRDIHPVSGLYYINGYGHEVYPKPNPQFIKNLSTSEVLVYSCGSLWTRRVRDLKNSKSFLMELAQHYPLPSPPRRSICNREISTPPRQTTSL